MAELDYKRLLAKNTWIVSKGQGCILSPDSDGLLCGLLMSHYFDWKIRGYYDGKVLLINNKTDIKKCVFLDMEIFRKEVKSVGHHMVLFNKKKKPENWNNFDNCIQPNNLRDFDGYKNFPLKYPLATIHLLIGIISNVVSIDIPKSGICPLLYTDGVFKNLFGYPENCLDWIDFLGANNKNSALHKIFHNDYYTINDLMFALKDFFAKIASLGDGKRGNDKLKNSNSKGELINTKKDKNGTFVIDQEIRNKAENFIKILSSLTGWSYKMSDWAWNNFDFKKFEKGNTNPNNKNFEWLLTQKPLSWTMTSGLAIEYTLDPKDNFLK